MTDFRVTPQRLRSMATTHSGAGQDVNALGSTQPSGVDGGEGGPHVLLMVADLGLDASALAQLNTGTASALRAVAADTQQTDCEAAAMLRVTTLDVIRGGS